jgi:hypothetical protein
MTDRAERYVESLASDLDRFLADFFPRKKWQSRVKYDHRAHRFFLDVILRDATLAGDDRFLSLVAFYSRGQRTMLHERAGLDMQCRLFSDQGADLTARLRDAEATYREDGRGSALGRRLAWLGFRQRLVRQVIPRSLLWAATIVLIVVGLGLTIPTAVVLCLVALGIQMGLSAVLSSRHR